MARKITPHYITGTLAKYETKTDTGLLVHSVTTSTRGPGYTVATFHAGFVNPRSIQTFPGTEEGKVAALAECKRRAEGVAEGPVLTVAATQIVALAMNPGDEDARATLESLSDAWEHLFRTGEHQTADRIATVLAALTMETRS